MVLITDRFFSDHDVPLPRKSMDADSRDDDSQEYVLVGGLVRTIHTRQYGTAASSISLAENESETTDFDGVQELFDGRGNVAAAHSRRYVIRVVSPASWAFYSVDSI